MTRLFSDLTSLLSRWIETCDSFRLLISVRKVSSFESELVWRWISGILLTFSELTSDNDAHAVNKNIGGVSPSPPWKWVWRHFAIWNLNACFLSFKYRRSTMTFTVQTHSNNVPRYLVVQQLLIPWTALIDNLLKKPPRAVHDKLRTGIVKTIQWRTSRSAKCSHKPAMVKVSWLSSRDGPGGRTSPEHGCGVRHSHHFVSACCALATDSKLEPRSCLRPPWPAKKSPATLASMSWGTFPDCRFATSTVKLLQKIKVSPEVFELDRRFRKLTKTSTPHTRARRSFKLFSQLEWWSQHR